MNRETQYSFAALPQTEIGRSKFDRSFNHATTWNNGDLIPIYCEHVMPGDTVNMNISTLVRMLTPMTPVMDSLYMDIMFFMYLIDYYGMISNISLVKIKNHGNKQ